MRQIFSWSYSYAQDKVWIRCFFRGSVAELCLALYCKEWMVRYVYVCICVCVCCLGRGHHSIARLHPVLVAGSEIQAGSLREIVI